MGLTFNLGRDSAALTSDASLNVGIGGSPSGSYKLEVTGTGYYSGVLRVGAATGFAVGSIAGYRRIEYSGTTFSFLTNADALASISAANGTFNAVASTFNGTVQSVLITSGANSAFTINAATASYAYQTFAQNGVAKFELGIDASTSNFYISNVPQTGSANANFTINKSTGIAIFSSSVQASKLILSTGASNNVYIGQDTGAVNYNVVSLNGQTGEPPNHMGLAGGGVSDNTLYISAPTGGSINFRQGGTSGVGVQIPSAGGMIIYQNVDNFGYEFRLRNTANLDWSFINGGDNVLYLGFNGAVRGTFNPNNGIYTPSSDVNKKKDFELSTIGLDAILGLKSTLYRMTDDEDTCQKHLGFIAQEVKEFIPQAYTETILGDTPFIGLDYQAITSALVKAVQEQNQIIQELNERLNKAGL